MSKEVILKDKYDNNIYPRTSTSAIYDENTGERLDNTIDTLKKSVSDGKTLVAGAITEKGVDTATDASFETMAENIGSLTDTRDATATAAQILSPQTAYVNGSKVTGTMTDNSTNTAITLSWADNRPVIKQDATSNACWVVSNSDGIQRALIQCPNNGYYSDTTVIGVPVSIMAARARLTAAKIATGNTILGVAGTYKGLGNATAAQVLSGKTFSTASLSNATGTMTDNSAKTSTSSYVAGTFKSGTTGYVFATPTAGYCSASTYIRVPVANLAAGNIKKGVSIGGVAGTYGENGVITKRTLTITNSNYLANHNYSTGYFYIASAKGDVIKSTATSSSKFPEVDITAKSLTYTIYGDLVVVRICILPQTTTYHWYTLKSTSNCTMLYTASQNPGNGSFVGYDCWAVFLITGDNPNITIVKNVSSD